MKSSNKIKPCFPITRKIYRVLPNQSRYKLQPHRPTHPVAKPNQLRLMKTEYRPLSKVQKAKLAQLAREAFETLYKNGLIDSEGDSKSAQFTNWRREQQSEAVGCESLTKCIQRDYLPLLAHFQSLTGQDGQAFNTHIKSQPSNDYADEEDTHEARQQVIERIKKEIEGSRYKYPYVCAIAKSKFRTTTLIFFVSLML